MVAFMPQDPNRQRSGLGDFLSTGLSGLAQNKLQSIQRSNQSKFWEQAGLPSQLAQSLSAQPEGIQKSILDRLEGLQFGGGQQQGGMQSLQGQQAGGVRLGANPAERRHQESLALQREGLDLKKGQIEKQAQEVTVEKSRQLSSIDQAKKLINSSKGRTSLGLSGNITPLSSQPKEAKQLQQIVTSLIPKNIKEGERKQWEKSLLPNIYDSPEDQIAKLNFLESQIGGQQQPGAQSQPEGIQQAQSQQLPMDQQAPQDQIQEGDQYTGEPSQSGLGWLGQQAAGIANQVIGTPYNMLRAMTYGGDALESFANNQNRNNLNKALQNPNLNDFQRKNIQQSLDDLNKRESDPGLLTKSVQAADEKVKDFQDTLFGKDYLQPKGDIEEGIQDIGSTIGLALATGTPWNSLAHIATRAIQGAGAKQAVKALGGSEPLQFAGKVGVPLLLDMFNPQRIMNKVNPVIDKRYKEAQKLAGGKTINVDPFRQTLEDIHENALGHPQFNTYRKDLMLLEDQLGSKFNEFPIKDLPKLKERVNKFAYKFNLDEFKPAVPAVHELIDEASQIVPAWGKEVRTLDKLTGAVSELKNAKTFFENFQNINTYKSIPSVAIRAAKSLFGHPTSKGLSAFSKLAWNDQEIAFKYASEMLQSASQSQVANFIKAANDLGTVLEKNK